MPKAGSGGGQGEGLLMSRETALCWGSLADKVYLTPTPGSTGHRGWGVGGKTTFASSSKG